MYCNKRCWYECVCGGGREGGALIKSARQLAKIVAPFYLPGIHPHFLWVCVCVRLVCLCVHVCVLVTCSYKGHWVSVCSPALSQVGMRGWCTKSLFLPLSVCNTWENLRNFWRHFILFYSDQESKSKNHARDFSISWLLCGGRLRCVRFYARGVCCGRCLLRLGGQGPAELWRLFDGRKEADSRAGLPVTDGQLHVCNHSALQPGWGKENPRRMRERSLF